MNSGAIKLFLILVIFVSCRQREDEHSPTSGNLTIICDESVSPVIQMQKQEFEKNYQKAHIRIKLGTTSYAIGSLLNNDVECIISTRELDSIETDFLIRNDIKVYSQKLALDGIAFLVNANNPLNELSLDQINSILTGKFFYWKDISDSLPFQRSDREIKVVFDGRKSGNYVLLRNQVTDHEPVTSAAIVIPGDSVTSSSERILKYISLHEDAIGYISTAWLGNNVEFLKLNGNIKILKISEKDYHKAVAPIPGYVYRGDYPLRRMIYIMHRQKTIGLAAGFTAYLTGNEGQRIFLNSNLVPAMNPVRLKVE